METLRKNLGKLKKSLIMLSKNIFTDIISQEEQVNH